MPVVGSRIAPQRLERGASLLDAPTVASPSFNQRFGSSTNRTAWPVACVGTSAMSRPIGT